MVIRHSFSRVRVSRAAVVAAACSTLLSLGQGCGGDSAIIIGAGGSPSESPNTEIEPSPALPPEGAEGGPSEGETPSGAPEPAEPPNPGPQEGVGGAPPLQPVSSGGAGAPSVPPSVPPAPPAMPEPPPPPDPEPPPPRPDPEPPPPEPTPPPPPLDPGEQSCEPAEGTLSGLHLTLLVNGLVEPIFVTAAPDDDTRLYVLEKRGAIRVILDGRLLAEPFLDLRGRVASEDEQGLVGLAFHPRYAENGRFFIQYALLDPTRAPGQDHQVLLSEFARSEDDADRADASSERILMVVDQPATIHLGGMLAFGPSDGMLYIARGDGGASGPEQLDTLTGKMLRIDVDGESEDRPYGIPEGNLTGDGVLPELWSRGLRNPWRFSFDVCTGDIYIGDVGESSFEEIDFEPANTPGRNYGWKTLEGPRCFDGSATCDASGVTEPVLVYDHGTGCAVTSGYVYRGERIAALRGTYLYADYCSGFFGSFRMAGGRAADVRDITGDINPERIPLITSFGVDNSGELYVLSHSGALYRIDPD
jgi:glucose/arabinose dehydrogenase